MPLRIEEERVPTDPAPLEDVPAHRPRRGAVMVTGSGVLLLAVLAVGIGGRLPGQNVGSVPAPAGPGVPTGAAPTAEPSVEPSSRPTPRPSPTPTGREVAPGLAHGTARMAGLNSDKLHGIPIGYPRTLDGAVAAAIAYDNAWHSPAMLNRKTRKDLNERLYTKEGRAEAAMDDDLAGALADALGINATGKVLTRKGKVDSKRDLIAAGYPRYGAYRVVSAQPSRTAPAEVVVASWRPFVLGTGSDKDLSKVSLSWTENSITVRWSGGDWRIAYINAKINPSKPADQKVPNQTYAARAKTLGPGWSVPADATQKLVPGTVVP